MERPSAFAENGNRQSLSKRDALTRYCQNQNDNLLANELLRAYEPDITRAVRPVAYRLCPGGRNFQDFFDAMLNRSRLKFIYGVCTYRGSTSSSWNAWLTQVARTAALEELDFLIHRRWKIPVIEIDLESTFTKDNERDSERQRDTWDRVFRSARYQGVMAQPLPPLSAEIQGRERKSIILKLLTLHAQQSQEGADSANAIRLRYWDDWSVVKIAEYMLGLPMTAGKEQAIRRELGGDYEKLRVLLKREFGITSLRQI